MRAALDHLARDADVGLTWIKASRFGTAARIARDTARLRFLSFVILRPPIGGPFPDIADHVEHAIAVGRKRRHRRGSLIAVVAPVLLRKFALPGVGHVHITGREFVAPGVLRAVEPATRGKFP